MEPIYETISLTSVVENHFINGAEPVVAPTHITMSENDAYFSKDQGHPWPVKTAITMSENDAYCSKGLDQPVKAAIKMNENDAYCSKGLDQPVKAAIKMSENDAYCFENHSQRDEAAAVTNTQIQTTYIDEGIESSMISDIVVKNEAYSSIHSAKMTNGYSTCEHSAHQRPHSWCHGYPSTSKMGQLQKPSSSSNSLGYYN